MKRLIKITLLQFRNYASATFHFNAKVTCITGPNGSGKTNLLDAIYYLCYTKSYFSAYQQNTVQTGLDGFRVTGIFEYQNKQESISCKWKQGKKEIFLNDKEYEKINDHIGKYSSVMIAPDDISLINEGSELRRKWIDSILSQTDTTYLEKLIRYQKVIIQRNAWLKMQSFNPAANNIELEYYNNQLEIDGSYLFKERTTFLNSFIPLLNEYYKKLTFGKEVAELNYNSELQENSLISLLNKYHNQDLKFQRTMHGIHKDELEFKLNSLSLKLYGSQGQKKSFLFALKLAQYAYLRQKQGKMPLLLLDDIFEKLDQNRMIALLGIIQDNENFGQVIITDTHPERIKQVFGANAEVDFIYL